MPSTVTSDKMDPTTYLDHQKILRKRHFSILSILRIKFNKQYNIHETVKVTVNAERI